MNHFAAAGPVDIQAGAVNISGQWSTLWGAITSAAPSITGILSAVGALLIIMALVMWIVKRRTQRGMGDMTAVWGSAIVGALLLAPAVVIPLVLTVLDLIINIVISLGEAII
jgi:hypothetical protein